MEAILQKISSKLGPKWVQLIMKLHFLSHRRRYDIEARYSPPTVGNRAVVFRSCALDCIREWMETEPIRSLDDEWKIKRLLYELRKIDDFVPLVEEVALSEGIVVPDESAFQDDTSSGLPDAHFHEQTQTKESEDAGVTFNVASTTRSVLGEFSQAETMSPSSNSNVAPLFSSIEGPSTWLYGDETSDRRDTVESAYPTTESEVKVKAESRFDLSRTEASGHESLPKKSIREDRMGGPDWGLEGLPHSASGEGAGHSAEAGAMVERLAGGSSAKHKAPVRRGLDEVSLSDGSVSSISGSQDSTATDISIQMNIRRHRFTLLDISQRLCAEKWEEIGKQLGLEEVFLGRISKECTEERYYLMLKKWVESSRGTATFGRLCEVLTKQDEDSAILVLEARLNSKGRILIRAVHNDI